MSTRRSDQWYSPARKQVSRRVRAGTGARGVHHGGGGGGGGGSREPIIPAQCPQGFTRYTVRAGDTMFLIARRFNISLDALILNNQHIPNPAKLVIGDVLCVPTSGMEPCPPSKPQQPQQPQQPLQPRQPFQPSQPTNPPPQSCPVGFIRYEVQPGDTMFLIARRFAISLDRLIEANPQIEDPSMLSPGDIICVPSQAQCAEGFRPHTVEAGETLFLLSRRFGITLDRLIEANPHITNPAKLRPGDTVCVPVEPNCPDGSFVHVVQPGETIFTIAQQFQVASESIIKMNPHIPDPSKLLPGDVLCIPPEASN